MTEKFEIWTGDGSIFDGSIYDDESEALRQLLEYLGWSYVASWYHYGDDGTTYVYRSEAEMEADTDGAHAPCVRPVEGSK